MRRDPRPARALRRLRSPVGRGGARSRAAPSLAACAFAALLSATAPDGALGAQLLDRGAFRLTVDGAPAGTEEFTIRRSGAGEAGETWLRGTIELLDGRAVTTAMRLVGPDASATLADYSAFVVGADTQAVRVVRSGDRLRTRTVASWGEEVSESRARPTTLLLEENVAHHYALLARWAESSGAPAVVHVTTPLAGGDETEARVESGPAELVVEGRAAATSRVRLSSAAGDAFAWFDERGRLVRVEASARGFVAIRVPGG